MSYVYLAIAIVAEVIGTSALKASEEFTRPVPSIVVVAGYAIAFIFLSLTLRTIPVGIAYAIWAGAGIALIVAAGAILFQQHPREVARRGDRQHLVAHGGALSARSLTLPRRLPQMHGSCIGKRAGAFTHHDGREGIGGDTGRTAGAL